MSLDTDFEFEMDGFYEVEQATFEIDAVFEKIRRMIQAQRAEKLEEIRNEENQELLVRQRKFANDLIEDRELSAQLGIDRRGYASPRDREYDLWNIAAYELAKREQAIEELINLPEDKLPF